MTVIKVCNMKGLSFIKYRNLHTLTLIEMCNERLNSKFCKFDVV